MCLISPTPLRYKFSVIRIESSIPEKRLFPTKVKCVMKNVCIFLCLFSTSVYCQNDVAVSETSSRKSKTILSESADAIDPAAIDIVRDKFGVPHIFARTDREVTYGLA